MLKKMDILRPYRTSIPAVLAAGIQPGAEVNVFGAQSGGIRARVIDVMRAVVDGAYPRLPTDMCQPLAEGLFFINLGVLALWSLDASPDQQLSLAMLRRGCNALDFAARFMKHTGLTKQMRWWIDTTNAIVLSQTETAKQTSSTVSKTIAEKRDE